MLVKYGISGSIAATVQLGTLYFLVEKVQVWHLYAVVYAFFTSAAVAFFLQKFWTFRDASLKGAHFQMVSYLVLALTALLLNVGLMYLFVDVLRLWYMLAQVLTMGLVVVIVFLCNKNIIFNRESVIFGAKVGAI